MSVVTNVILVSEIGESHALESINARMGWTGNMALTPVGDEEHGDCRDKNVSGDKRLQSMICVGAYNYLDRAKLIEAVRSAAWDEPGVVRLYLRGEGWPPKPPEAFGVP